MARWFGSSGIRGAYGNPITDDFALRLGLETGAPANHLIVGHDARLTSPLLARAFVAGALSAGAQVDFCGGVATPSLAYAAKNYDAGVMVTASHNPPADNGFKFWNPDGSAWGPSQEQGLEVRLSSVPVPRPAWKDVGQERGRPDVTEEHLGAVLNFVGPVRLPAVLDCGSGAGGWIAPALLRRAGVEATVLHGEPDGRFPHRDPEPNEASLAALRERCRKEQAWGIAHDGDADRMVAVDPEGRLIPPDVVLVALAVLLRAKRIVAPVDCSLALAAALPDAYLDICRVGDAAVSTRLRETRGDLGGETSGTYVVPRFNYAPDGPLAGLLFLKAASQGLVDVARQRMPHVVRRSEKVPIDRAARSNFGIALNRIEALAGERELRVDGLRLDNALGWLLVRPSGTEPAVRLTVEAWNDRDAEVLLDRARMIASTALRHALDMQKAAAPT